MKIVIITALILSALALSACGRGYGYHNGYNNGPMYDNGNYRTLPADAPEYMRGGRHNGGGQHW